MQFSVGVEYSLHCLLHMVTLPRDKSIGIKALAKYQGVSESYLSKMFSKLVRAGLIESVPGVKGGYGLAKPAEEISFWDVVTAVEGRARFFQCDEIRQREAHIDPDNIPDTYCKSPCLIKSVMWEGERQMEAYLSGKNLAWLFEQVANKLGPAGIEEEIQWFEDFSKGKKG